MSTCPSRCFDSAEPPATAGGTDKVLLTVGLLRRLRCLGDELFITIVSCEYVAHIIHRLEAATEAELHYRVDGVLLGRLLQQPVRYILPRLSIPAIFFRQALRVLNMSGTVIVRTH